MRIMEPLAEDAFAGSKYASWDDVPKPVEADDGTGLICTALSGEQVKVPYQPDGDYLLELERADARRRAAAPAEDVIAEIEAGARFLGQLRELRRGFNG